MKRMALLRQLLIIILLIPASYAVAQDIPARPDPPRLVNDLAGLLDPDLTRILESQLVAFSDSTGTQIVVLTVPALGDYDPSQFAYEVGQQWGVGQKGQDNGVVILVKPKTPTSAGEAFIAPGYGLEPVIPDATAKLIVENEMIPRFRQNDYPGGIRAGVQVVMSLASGEFPATGYTKKEKPRNIGGFIAIVIFLIIFFLVNNRRNKHNHIGKDMSFLTWLMLLGAMNQGRGGHYGDFRSGSGGFGGGGFGGFGGGGFGGGGAGGSW